MSLPKLQVPLYDVTLPSETKVTYRPFLVKEEKLLLMAKQSDDTESMLKAIQQVLRNCLITPQDVEKLPLFDMEFLFLQLRARSVGEIVTLKYQCNKVVPETDKACGMISEYPVDLLKITPTFGPGHSKVIQLTDTVGVKMTYPSYTTFKSVAREDLPAEDAFDALVSCIESVFDEKGVYYTKDIAIAEMREFIESLRPSQVKLIDAFFDTLPKIETTIKFNCPRCDSKEDILVSGLDSFFV